MSSTAFTCFQCKWNTKHYASYIRHFKTHIDDWAKAMLDSEKAYALENNIPLVFTRAKNGNMKVCVCAICKKLDHCERDEKSNHIVKIEKDESENVKINRTGKAQAFYDDHKSNAECKAKFETVRYLFDSTVPKPKGKPRGWTVAKKPIVFYETPPAPVPPQPSKDVFQKYIARQFPTIFDKYFYESEDESDEDEKEDCREQRYKQRNATAESMISEIAKVFKKITTDTHNSVQKAKTIAKNEFKMAEEEYKSEIAQLHKTMLERDNQLFEAKEENRNLKKKLREANNVIEDLKNGENVSIITPNDIISHFQSVG